MSERFSDDGGIDWPHVISLAETARAELATGWAVVGAHMPDVDEVWGGHFMEAEVLLIRLIKRAKVMRAREDIGDGGASIDEKRE